jgi:hypothetical protein
MCVFKEIMDIVNTDGYCFGIKFKKTVQKRYRYVGWVASVTPRAMVELTMSVQCSNESRAYRLKRANFSIKNEKLAYYTKAFYV